MLLDSELEEIGRAIGVSAGEVKKELMAMAEAHRNATEESLAPIIDEQTQLRCDVIDLSTRLNALPAPKDGIDGEPGEKGDPGEPGQDRPIIQPARLESGRPYDKNTLGAHAGGLWIATKNAADDPDGDPGAWMCVLEGARELSCILHEPHAYKMTITGSDGTRLETDLVIPYPEHKGIYDPEKVYTTGQIVTKGAAMFQALDTTDQAPPGGAWQQILVAPRGKTGPAGKPGKDGTDGRDGIDGVDGKEGPRGKPGRNGKDASLDPEFIAELKALAAETKVFQDGRSDAIQITSFRGYFSERETYRPGDVVDWNKGLWINLRGGQFERISDDPTAWQNFYTAPILDVANYMLYQGDWQPGTYNPGSVVVDGGYTMVATRRTNDTAAPQAAGDPYWITDNLAPATFPNSGTITANILRSGNRYQAHVPGWVDKCRVYLPAVDADERYTVTVSKDGFERARIGPFSQQDATDAGYSIPGWVELNIPTFNVLVGVTLEAAVETYTIATSTNLIDTWSIRTHPNQSPGAGEIVQRGGELETILVHQVGTVDNSTFMDNLGPGDDMIVGGLTRDILSASKAGAVYTFTCSPASALPTGSQEVEFVDFATQPINVAVETNYWGLNPPPSGIAEGFVRVDDDPETVNTTLYGTDVRFTPAYISPDWDMIAYSNLGGTNVFNALRLRGPGL